MGVIVEIGDPQCHALNLSDGERCIAQAVAYNDKFCRFHAKQCFGLYVGYKRRNGELDVLDNDAPTFLQKQIDGGAPVANVSFKTLKDTAELQEVHDHLFRQYVLLGKVIGARQLHHKHFFSVDMDYGHKVYLEKLQARRAGVLRALENLEKRTAAVLYEREQWFKWVRTSQSEEEATRDKEQKKVKMEAAMFQRHWKEVQSRMGAVRDKEEKKKQDAYLEQAWKERMEEASYESEAADEDWDPIEDVLEEEREKYVDLIRRFLWIEIEKAQGPVSPAPEERSSATPAVAPAPTPTQLVQQPTTPATPVTVEDEGDNVENIDPASTERSEPSKSKGEAKKKKKKSKTPATNPGTSSPSSSKALKIPGKPPEVGKGHIETQGEIRKRLKEGIERDRSGMYGPQLIGTIKNPVETLHRTPPIPDEEIDKLLQDISEIKVLLFCRTLLSHATLLPAALRAKSVQDFLADPEVSDSDLRDLCLKVEQPNLQALRDACADFARGDDPEPPPPEDEVDALSTAEMLRRDLMYGDLDEMTLFSALLSNNSRNATRKERARLLEESQGSSKASKSKRIKITVCGKTIWNYTSEHAMARDGWLQFSIMAKDCTFNEAVELCRNWDEFFELQTLTLWDFFPSAKWSSWAMNTLHEQLLQLGFIAYHMQFDGKKRTMHNQTGSKGRQRRQHHMEECRNLICGHMKRGDPATNRFIDYCKIQSGELMILVRDGVTGQVVTGPVKKEEDEHWIYRVKSGLGRASKNEWEVLEEVDRDFFDYVESQREWRFGFDAHYEIYIWDFLPGGNPMDLLHRIQDALVRALRISHPRESSRHQRHILENLIQDPETKRVRQMRPGEQATTIWETLAGPEARFAVMTSSGKQTIISASEEDDDIQPSMWYNETDAAEDEVLFASGRDQGLYKEITNPIVLFENSSMPMTILDQRALELTRLLEGLDLDSDGDEPVAEAYRAMVKKQSSISQGKEVEGAEQFIHSVPPIWRQAYLEIERNIRKLGKERAYLLEGLDFFSTKLQTRGRDLMKLDKLELMERDRSYVSKDTFHLADLEPGTREKYVESTKIIMGAQNHTFDTAVDTDWTWLCLEILDSLSLKAWYDDYVREPLEPWPHRYLTQDITQAFIMMGLFFPKLQATNIIQDFLKSDAGRQFKGSKLFDPAARSQDIPDRRTRDSCSIRPKSFYEELERIKQCDSWSESFPWDWKIAVRPIIAKLYRAGIIEPSNTPPWREACSGLVFAAEEPHRPGKLDLFTKFEDMPNPVYPPNYVDRKDWPPLLPPARAFAQKHPGARFAMLRIWSAPHFWPLMIGYWNRPNFTFIDSENRAWEWKFIPKDQQGSEWSTHTTTMTRMELIFERAERNLYGSSRLKGMREKVAFRGDGILVMGEDEEDLLRLSTTVTFAVQTKPWLREIDLWKSYINVDLACLEGLDPCWMD